MATKHAFSRAFNSALALLTDLCLSRESHSYSDRPLLTGSDLIGEYNFRTGGLDCGADPNGWYEEDV